MSEQPAQKQTARQQEIKKLEKQHEKSVAWLKYLPLIVVIVTIVYMVDEITSNMNGTMRPYMIFDLFKVPGASTTAPEYESAISKMAVATIPTYILTALLPLYKTLSDKFGRKIFLVLNTLGMGLGLFMCMTAGNYLVYILGTVVFGFFTPNDMQVIYLMEVSPKKRRATLCSVAKGIGLMSVSLIGVFRTMFYDPQVLSTWRLVFLIPVIMALVIGVVCIFTLKETPIFLEQKISALKAQEAAAGAQAIADAPDPKAEKSATKGSKKGIKATIHFMFHDRQLRSLMLALVLFEIAVALVGYGPETMLAFGQSDADMNLFYIVEPMVYAVFAFFSGFLSDKVGRRNSALVFGLIALVFEIVFVLCARSGIDPWVLALADGIMYGGLWSFSDLMFILVPSESAPTQIRASVVGLLQYTAITNILTTLLVGIFYSRIGTTRIALFQLAIFVPIMIIVLIFVARNLKETQNVDLDKAGTGTEA